MTGHHGSKRTATPLPGRFQLETDLVPQGDQPAAIDAIVQRVERGEKFVTLLGVTGSGKTFTMAHSVARLQRPTLVISPNKTLAAQLVSEFRALFPKNAVEYFVSYYDYYQPEAYVPQIDLYIEKDASINEEIDRLRHRATQALLTRRDVLIVASVSCIYGLGSPEDYRASVVELTVGQEISRQTLLEQFVRMKYSRNDIELKRGRFRVRGGTIDVMGAGETVHRVVLDGNTIKEIVELDPLTQEERRSLTELAVFPATHFLTVDERLRGILSEIERERDARVKELKGEEKIVEAQRLNGRVDYDLEMIRETGYCSGIENYARYFAGRRPGEPPYTLLDFFPDDFLCFIDESHVTLSQLQGMYKGDRSRKDNLVEFGWRLPSARDNRPLKFPEFLTHVPQNGVRLGDARTVRAEGLEGAGRADHQTDGSRRPTHRGPAAERSHRRPHGRAQGRDRTRRSGARDHAHEGDERGARELPREPGVPGPLPPFGGRDDEARRDPARPSPRPVRRVGRDQPPARGARPARGQLRRDPGCR